MKLFPNISLWLCLLLQTLTCHAQTEQDTTKLLNRTPIQLREVVINSRKWLSKADKIIMRVAADDNKNGEELLRQAPHVVISDKDLTIHGEGGTKLFVNDREIRLTGDNLLTYLRSLNAKDIDRIEVQEMASAADDANAKGGIIRIRLRHRTTNDCQGNMTLKSLFSDRTFGMQPSASFSLHQGRWDMYSFGSGSFTPKDKGTTSSTRQYSSSADDFVSDTHISSPAVNVQVSAGAFYTIDSTATIGAEAGYFHQHTRLGTLSNTTLTIGSPSVEDNIYSSIADYLQIINFNMYSATLNYRKLLDHNGSNFKILADYARKESTNNNHYLTRWLWTNRDTAYIDRLSSDYDIASANLSYTHVTTSGSSLQTGIKFTATQMRNSSIYESLTKYQEYISAAYAEFQTAISHWQLSAGLRAEYTQTRNSKSDIHWNYLNLYPHLSICYALDEMKRWMISMQYARQIERPAFDALNPNRIQLSQYSYQIGNPDLRPTYIHKLSTTLIRDYRYTLTIGCQLHTDLIREFALQDPTDRNVSYIMYENHQHENHWFVNLSAPIQIGRLLNITTSLTAVRQCIQKESGDAYSNHNLVFVNCTAGITLPRDYALELTYNMHNRLYSGNSSIATANLLLLKVKKSFCHKKILLTAGIDNLLDEPNRYQSQLSEYLMQSESRLGSDGRVFTLSLTYNFSSGKKRQIQRVENSSADERSRMNQPAK